MRTEQQIRDRIEFLEDASAKLLDKQCEPHANIYSLESQREELERQADELRWVLNE